MRRVVYFLILISLTFAKAADLPEKLELQDRRVDQAALQSKKKAIDQLKKLIARHRGTEQEPLMWVKLAEFQQQASGIEFRVAHGEAHRTQTSPKLSRYFQSLNEVVSSTTHLIQKFSREVSIDQIYSMRGAAFEELKKKELAKKDYLFLVQHFPDSSWATQSYMSLADFAIEDNQHEIAIRYLKAVEAQPDDSHYPFALYKLAWSHFNLKQITIAINYLKKHIQFYRGSTEESDRAILEHSLLDLTSFYLQGFEDHLPEYTTAQALNDFRKIESGPILGQMALRYAKLLRSHTHDADLIQWKNQLIQEEYLRPETLEVILISMEYFLNNKQLDRLLECAANIAQVDNLSKMKIKTFSNYGSIQTQILAISDRLQKMILKNKNATELSTLIHALQGVYQSFIDIAPEEDSRVPRIHYNLAETLFQIKDYARSSEHYFWVYQHFHKRDGLDRKEVLIKLISSKYQTLDQKSLIPKKVVAHRFNPEKKDSVSELNPEVSQWIAWLDEFLNEYGYERPEVETFVFEGNRTLYSQKQTVEALRRLKKAVNRNPSSQISVASASLIMDTYITSELWDLAHEEAHDLIETFEDQKVNHSEFITRMKNVESDSYYKMIESDYLKKNYKDALKKIRNFQKNYSSSARYNDCLLLASKLAQETHQKELALEFLSLLITQSGTSDHQSEALLQRAALEEEKYQFDLALQDEVNYLQKKPNSSVAKSIYPRIYLLSWLTRQKLKIQVPKELQKDLSEEQDRTEALYLLHATGDPGHQKIDLAEKALHGIKENRSIWALNALQKDPDLSFHEIQNLLRVISSTWEKLDPIAQFDSLPLLQDLTPKMIKRSRLLIKKLSPLRATSKSIEHHIQFMTELEKTASKLLKLPWAKIKVEVLEESAGMYQEFAQGLSQLPIPKDLNEAERAEYLKSVQELVVPFTEKSKKLKAQAYEIATELAVQTEIVQRLLPESSASSSEVRPESQKSRSQAMSPLLSIDLWNQWKAKTNEPQTELIQAKWADAIQQKNYAQIAFFIQELKSKTSIPQSQLKLMRVFSLAAVGAQSEALSELESIQDDFEAGINLGIRKTLYQFYKASHSDKKAQSKLEEMEGAKK